MPHTQNSSAPQSLDMYVSCPHCKKQFEIPVNWVMKYVDRVIWTLSGRLTKAFVKAGK
ncbi:hypothetical protein HYR54_12310 [Candidatus Acetothermia bacterium]|nr:hypothetical protein [Candidatus Acetothermia bacterium]